MTDLHPDRELLWLTRQALDAWELHGPRTVTSSILGSGAVAAAESLVSRVVAGRQALLLSSASLAMLTALRVSGAGPGTSVLLPRYDWTASLTVVRLLGATPVFVEVDEATGTIDPASAITSMQRDTVAVVACHLHGVPPDVPALRRLLPGVRIIEDCAQGWDSRLDGAPAGSLGDLAVFSFASTKTIDSGEIGCLVSSEELADQMLRLAVHPSRQVLTGIDDVSVDALGMRPDPIAAIRLWHSLKSWDRSTLLASRAEVIRMHSTTHPRENPMGEDTRRSVISNVVAFRAPAVSAVAFDLTSARPMPMPGVRLVLTRSGTTSNVAAEPALPLADRP